MSQCESPVGPPLEFVAEPDQLREVPDELDDGPEGARADLGLAGRHAAKVHQADAGGRACPVRPRQAVHQDGVSFGGGANTYMTFALIGEENGCTGTG